MLRQAVELAYRDNRLVVFLEPIALYMTRDLHAPGDNGWTFELPAPDAALPEFGTPAVVEADDSGQTDLVPDLVIVSYANGFYLSRQAQQELAAQGIRARGLDIRYLVPLHADKIAAAIGDFLVREAEHIQQYRNDAAQGLPFRLDLPTATT